MRWLLLLGQQLGRSLRALTKLLRCISIISDCQRVQQ